MSSTTCGHCTTASTALKLCSRCKEVSYCNKACQKADWKHHKAACKRLAQPGDVVRMSFFTRDPYQPRAFPTFDQRMDECEANGTAMIMPDECCIQTRLPNGVIDTLIDEDKYQEYQRKEAEKKAAKAMRISEEKAVGEEGK